MFSSFKSFLLELFFPKFCFGCHREGYYLCEDCLSCLEILEWQYCLCKKPIRLFSSGKCSRCLEKNLNGLYFALAYQSPLLQKLIHYFKYYPFVKGLAKPLASLIITHLQLSSKHLGSDQDLILVPIPLTMKKERKRGFNQAKEIAKELSNKLELPLIDDVLLKIKETLPQVDLEENLRIQNPKGSFLVKNEHKIMGKKILLVDDVYTTGSTMEECSKILRDAGAKEVWGVAIARG